MSQQIDNFFKNVTRSQGFDLLWRRYPEFENFPGLSQSVIDLVKIGKFEICFDLQPNQKEKTIFAEKFLYYPEDFQIDILEICDNVEFLHVMFSSSVEKCQFNLSKAIALKINTSLIDSKSFKSVDIISRADLDFFKFCIDNNFYEYQPYDIEQLKIYGKLDFLELVVRNGVDLNSFDETFQFLCSSDPVTFLYILRLSDKYNKPIDLKKKFRFGTHFFVSSIGLFPIVENTDFEEKTIANYAVEHNQKYIIEALFEYGIKINDLKKNYLTPENRDLIKKLL